MAKNGRYQLLGDEIPLNSRSPIASPSSDPRSGTFQLQGDKVRMSQKPIQSPSSNPRSGSFEYESTCVPLSRTPQKGWGSAYNLAMSQRAIDQSKNSVVGGGKRKKR